MSVKIRLQRYGKKGKPFFHIVIANSISKRDGRFIEKIGTYDPNTNPASINLDTDNAVKWLNNGAQPTNTVRAILSYKGVLYKKHLAIGVAKGALNKEEAEKKFNEWLEKKNSKIAIKSDAIKKATDIQKQKPTVVEDKTNEKKEVLAGRGDDEEE